MPKVRSLLLASAATVLFTAPASAFDGVVASIKPVHSLVAGVMQGVGEPALLVQGAGSPHDYTMRPSDAANLQSANVVFWVSHELEVFLPGPLATLAPDARTVELAELPGMTLHRYREGATFEAHDHGDHDDDHSHDHEEHAHEQAEHGHDQDEEHAHSHDEDEHDHSHDDGHDHVHGEYDMHIWLDPENAKVMVGSIRDELSQADPDNADTYRANAADMAERLDQLSAEISGRLSNVSGDFIVFHDAYNYFETRFGLSAAGAITLSPEIDPGARRVGEVQGRVRELGAACIFAEPQFEPSLVRVVAEGSDARTGVLDPLGAEIADGPDLYFELLRNLTTSFETCLSAN